MVKPQGDIEIVEIVAQAIRDTFGNRSGRARPWSEIPRTLRESYRNEARAALKAARDYTDSLLILNEADKRVAIEDAKKAKHLTISQRARE
jgi:hypothetical protein